ncbi:NS4 protein [Corriparta virus]|uniref:NS4 protein n=1 Tax=Corriparta virus TaxID=40053 RepID=T1SRJ8_9REOV|nr:NS4 protein [Corriparta virus]AGT51063.1 NS4 protein [Corriparta virus]
MDGFQHLQWLKRELTTVFPEADPMQYEEQIEIAAAMKNPRRHTVDQLLPQMYYYPPEREDVIKTMLRQRIGMLKMVLEEMLQLLHLTQKWDPTEMRGKLRTSETLVRSVQKVMFGTTWDYVPSAEMPPIEEVPRMKRKTEMLEHEHLEKRWC